MRVEIVCKNDWRACTMAGELHDSLQARGVEVELLNSDGLPEIGSRPAADLVFVLGGDGALLQTARLFACAGTPIVGVNLGTVGFLSSVEPGDLQFYLDELLRQEYDLEVRFMIAATVTREQQVLYRGIALNDVVLRSRVPHTGGQPGAPEAGERAGEDQVPEKQAICGKFCRTGRRLRPMAAGG